MVEKESRASLGNERIPSFAKSALRVGRSGFKTADAATLERRLASCGGCESARISLVVHCLRCGCLMNVKARFVATSCPRVDDGEVVDGW